VLNERDDRPAGLPVPLADAVEQVAQAIDTLLPQTQCGRCGFDGCLPYARALATGRVDIDRCPPGGAVTRVALADLLGRGPVAPRSRAEREPQQVAWIAEQSCIGCTKCIQVCPVDAIVGAQGYLHAVIPQQCTGCGLCLPPCPTDCITLLPAPAAKARGGA